MNRVIQPGEKQLVASVILLTGSRPIKTLLVHHRKYDLWLSPGGHVDPDENPLQTAIREVREETGIDISSHLVSGEKVDDYAFLIPFPQFFLEEKIPAYEDAPEHFHLDMQYVVELAREENPRLETEKAKDIGWFTWEEVKELKTFDNTKYMLGQLMQPAQT